MRTVDREERIMFIFREKNENGKTFREIGQKLGMSSSGTYMIWKRYINNKLSARIFIDYAQAQGEIPNFGVDERSMLIKTLSKQYDLNEDIIYRHIANQIFNEQTIRCPALKPYEMIKY